MQIRFYGWTGDCFQDPGFQGGWPDFVDPVFFIACFHKKDFI
jgi:hypothetical protein